MIKAVINAKLVLPGGTTGGCMLIEDGVILAAGSVLPPRDAEIIDAGGLYVGPGYVDIHCHGGGKARAETDPEEAARHHLQGGTTSLCVSPITVPKSTAMEAVRKVRKAMENPDTNIVGIYFEGPFRNPKYGANSAEMGKMCLADYPDKRAYQELFDEADGLVMQCAYAPERPGVPDIIEFEDFLSERNIPMAAGHTEMNGEQLDRAMSKGLNIITHLFDAMGCWRGKDTIAETGIIQDTASDVALSRKGLYYELICDSRGVHVKPANVRLAYRTAGIENIVIITDSVIREHDPNDYPPDDPRSFDDLNYNYLKQLSGSLLTMEMSARNFKRFTGANVDEVFMAAAANPARAVRIYDRVGSLEPGKQANFIMCNENMDIDSVYLRGRKVR